MITGMAHVCFVVRDLETAITFYVEKLGLAHAFNFRNEKGERTGVYLHVGYRQFIELFQGNRGERDDTQSYRHLCLEVDDLRTTLAILRERGVETTEMLFGGDNSWQSWLTDPDGNRIELHQYTNTSLQNVSL